MRTHLPSANPQRFMRKTIATEHIGCLFSTVQAHFLFCFCLCSLRRQSALLEEIPSKPVGLFLIAKPCRSCQCGALHLPCIEPLHHTDKGLNSTSFISSQKFPQNPDRYCVQKEIPGLTILWFPLYGRIETHNTNVRGFYIFHTS